jgi:hypothetical protein
MTHFYLFEEAWSLDIHYGNHCRVAFGLSDPTDSSYASG